MAKHIFVVLGASKSGKDTVAKSITAVNVKFAEPVKRTVERAKGLPLGCIDALDEADNCKHKVLDLLVESFDKASWVQRNLWIPEVTHKADKLLAEGTDVVFTDVRRSEERDAIISLWHEHEAVLHTIEVVRAEHKMLNSDINLPSLVSAFRSISQTYLRYFNNKSIQDLHRDIFAYQYTLRMM